jgi:hypothetical protein
VSGTFPDLLPRYQRAYVGTNPPADYQTALDARVERIRTAYRFAGDSMRMRRGEDEFERVLDGADAHPAGRVGPQLTLPI